MAVPCGILLLWFCVRQRGVLSRGTPRKEFITAVAVIVVLSGLTGVFAAEGTVDYFQTNGWKFQYIVSFGLTGAGPVSVIVPIVVDRSLLANLRLWSGSANWSYVETPYGPGLYVVVREDLTWLTADFIVYPPPAPLPDTSFTMKGMWGSSVSTPWVKGWAWIYSSTSSALYAAVRTDNYTGYSFGSYVAMESGVPLTSGWQQLQVLQYYMNA